MPLVAELVDRAVGLSWESCEQLLGEPIVVDDPLVTAGQVGRLLGLERGQVLRLHRQGWLERHENTQAGRFYRLSNVLELIQPITVTAAAELIGCAPQRVTVHPHRALRRLDAVLQRGRRRRPPDVSWPIPADDAVRLMPVFVDDDADRWVDLVEAAKILGLSHITAQRMAASGQLPAVKVGGVWRVQRGKVVLVRNAREAAAARLAPPPTAPG